MRTQSALSVLAAAVLAASVAAPVSAVEPVPGTAVVPRHTGPDPAHLIGWSVNEYGAVVMADHADTADSRYYVTTAGTELVAVPPPPTYDALGLAGNALVLLDEPNRTVRFRDVTTAATRAVTYSGTFAAVVPGAVESVVAYAPGEAANTFVLTRYGLGDPVAVATITCASFPSWRAGDDAGFAFVCPSATDAASDEIRIVTYATGSDTLLATVPRVNSAFVQLSDSTVAWRHVAPEPPHAQSIATVPRDGSAAMELRALPENPSQFALAGDHVAWIDPADNTAHTAPVDADAPEGTPFAVSGNAQADVLANGDSFVLVMNSNAGPGGLSRFQPGDSALTLWVAAPGGYATPWRVDLDSGRVVYADDSESPAATYARTVSSSGGTTSVGAESVVTTTDWWPGSAAVSGSRVARIADDGVQPPAVVVTDLGVEVRRVPVTEDLVDVDISGRRLLLTNDGDSAFNSVLVDVVTGGRLVLPYGAALWGRYVVYVDSANRIVRRDLDALPTSTGPRILRSGPPSSCPSCIAEPENTMLSIHGDDVFWVVWGDGDAVDMQLAHVTPSSLTRRPVAGNDVVWGAVGPAGLALAEFSGSLTATDLSIQPLTGAGRTGLGTGAFLVAPSVDDRYVAWAGSDGAVRVVRSPYASSRAARLLSTVAPPAFSPNGDGVRETWAPAFDADTALSSWTLTVRNAAGSVVATRSGSAPSGAIRPSWDGRADTTGARVADGTYSWTLAGTGADGDGGLRRSDGVIGAITGTVGVRTRRPTATASAPASASDTSTRTTFAVSWGTTSPGVRSYDVAYQETAGGPLKSWLNATTARSATFGASGKPVTPAQGKTYRFLVRARDDAGNVGAWRGATTAVPYDDRSSAAAYAGTWTNASSASRWLSTLRMSSVAGSRMRVTTTMRQFRLVGDRCASCGAFRVYVDGVLVATVDSYSPSTKTRQVLWSRTFSSLASRSVLVVVAGTAGRPKVALDAYAVTR